MSRLITSDEDKLEEFESCVILIEERVIEFKNNKNVTEEILNEFMSEYIDLEDKILTYIDKLSHVNGIDEVKMDQLIKKFNTYWELYQNDWPENYWDTYDMYRVIKDKDISPKFMGMNIKPVIVSDLIYEEGFDKCHALPTEENFQADPINQANKNLPEKVKLASTNDESMNTSYLGKIDEELKEVQEINLSEKKEEKRRSCLDCNIF